MTVSRLVFIGSSEWDNMMVPVVVLVESICVHIKAHVLTVWIMGGEESIIITTICDS